MCRGSIVFRRDRLLLLPRATWTVTFNFVNWGQGPWLRVWVLCSTESSCRYNVPKHCEQQAAVGWVKFSEFSQGHGGQTSTIHVPESSVERDLHLTTQAVFFRNAGHPRGDLQTGPVVGVKGCPCGSCFRQLGWDSAAVSTSYPTKSTRQSEPSPQCLSPMNEKSTTQVSC